MRRGYLSPVRGLSTLLVLLVACIAAAERILLVPLDSRPAAGQFAQMIAKMGGVDVEMPPLTLLGRFTSPGMPDAILSWLEIQDYSKIGTVIVSTDMICYGGLIASRVNEVSAPVAVQRLRRLGELRKKRPGLKIYVFSAIMRLAPTATRNNASWRSQLSRLAELEDEFRQSGEPGRQTQIQNLLARVPPHEVQRYRLARDRNASVQRSLVYLTEQGLFDYLVIGQDDARAFGPHVPETERLKRIVRTLDVSERVYFCEGIDQHSNVLISRAMLSMAGWTPKVRIVYSDDDGRRLYAHYESKTIEESLTDQLLASGAVPMAEDGHYDYALYVNVPGRKELPYRLFEEQLTAEVDQGFPVAVADINLGVDGTADPVLFDKLWDQGRMQRLLSYAGWNTAGNTMGTAIPAANVYLLSRRLRVDPLQREIAQHEFLLHRYVNDFAYHRFTRPRAYQIIDSIPAASREETYGYALQRVDSFVRDDLGRHLDEYFRDQFQGKRFFAGTGQYAFTGLNNVRISLPWPRAYEVRLEFQLQAQPVVVSTEADR
jgi:hypothetical protein